MKRQLPIHAILIVICAVMLWATWSKGRQLADLRARRQDVLSQLSSVTDPSTLVKSASSVAETAPEANSSDLLKLRNEINRLTQRKKELAAVVPENQRLLAQLASTGTNNQAALPADYVRKSAAQNRGYTTPQNTLETFLWAVQNRDLPKVLESFTPETASRMQQSLTTSGRSIDDFFREANGMPGLRIVSSQPVGADQIKLLVEFAPGMDPTPMELKQINGEWKLRGPW